MLFHSVEFFIFFAVLFPLLIRTVPSNRWRLLLPASWIFYMAWNPIYITLILFTTGLNYLCAMGIEKAHTSLRRRTLLLLSLVGSLGLLFVFKYLDFAISVANDVLRIVPSLDTSVSLPYAELLLPVGISFYTFQALGYTIDVFRGKIDAERHFGYMALYVAFFPQLVAGPIERGANLLPQLHQPSPITATRLRTGGQVFLWGMFKKVCVADTVSPIVDMVYDNPDQCGNGMILFATFLFGIQVYGDFSGYSDMAIGAARMIGYDLMTNFRQPYFSSSLTEFWRRWHVSLSTWFKDYVYIPLGGNRVVAWRWRLNIFLVFVISGVWHGAGWNFLIWGAIHGLWLVGETIFRSAKAPLPAADPTEDAERSARWGRRLGWLAGFLITNAIVLITWVFFRAQDMTTTVEIFRGLARPGSINYGDLKLAGVASFEVLLLVLHLGTLLIVDAILYSRSDWVTRVWNRAWIRFVLITILVWDIALFGAWGGADFIYFQF
jgi:D-alanyl-lipoteichoic acid acyltransferase DltB (MBOAT superfamily)